MAENSLSLEVPLPIPGCQPNYSHLKGKVQSSGASAPLYRMCGLMLSLISLRELGGDGDCVSVREPKSVNSFPAPPLGWMHLGLYPSIACRCVHRSVWTCARTRKKDGRDFSAGPVAIGGGMMVLN